MQFKIFFFKLDRSQRKDFAEKVGTSVGHLMNFCYGYTKLAPKVCVRIERESERSVMRQELCEDWRDIWPELADLTSATSAKLPGSDAVTN